MDLVTLITVKLTANQVGRDAFGNRYYEERHARRGKPPRRYVRYNGMTEASKVPADWHGWLHRTFDTAPSEVPLNHKPWEKPHQENLTGTAMAYAPAGSIRRAQPAERADYEAWQPE